jgi:Tfp pilus assembly protein PilX
MPITISVLVMAAMLAAVAASSAVTAQRGSTRDRGVKRAVEAADAGLNVAAYRMNKFATVLTYSGAGAKPCVDSSGATLTTVALATSGSPGWCPPQTETLGDGGSFTYRTSDRYAATFAGQAVSQRKIVSTGTVNGVSRRAVATVATPSGTPLFSAAVFSEGDLTMENNSLINGTVRSNANITTTSPANICGDAIAGPGGTVTGGNTCAGYSNSTATNKFVLNDVVVATGSGVDGNARLTASDSPSSSPTWSSTARTLAMDGSDQLTLGGNVYVLCNLTMSNSSEIHIPNDGTPVRVYIDAPENCGGAGTGNVNFQQSAGFDNTSGNPAMLELYVAGSNTIPTAVTFQNNHDLTMVVYAPNSDVTFDNHNTFLGAIAGKTVSIHNNSTITYDSRAQLVAAGDVPLQIYNRLSWVECTPAQTGSTPDSGC